MSLLKQLLLSVTLAICIILVGTLWLALDGARTYLNSRLHVDAENAASSLALSLSQPGNQDPVTQQLLMAALFDSGQYRSVALTAPDGEVLHLLERPTQVRGASAPVWFDAWFPIEPVAASRAVSDGWTQTGEVTVTPEDGPARATLWRMTYQLMLLIVGAGVLWAVFAILLMRWLRRALAEEVLVQVRAIAEGSRGADPPPTGASTSIKELAQVRNVIASVRERVRATADEQNRHIETLQIELNTDEVTGVANRKYFVNELRRHLSSETPELGDIEQGCGHVLIFRQRDLPGINAAHDRAQTDAWLRRVGDTIKSVLATAHDPHRPQPSLARLNGSDFAILLPGYDGPDTTDLIESLRQTLESLRLRTSENRLCRWSYALTDYVPGCDVGKVLGRLDHGLMRAENAGHAEVEYMASSDYPASTPRGGAGETAWKTLIQDAIRDDRLEIMVEPAAYRDDDTTDRHEALLQLRDADDPSSIISGYLFMPPAVRLGLSAACDLRALELTIRWVQTHPGNLAVRVSLASMLQADFLPGMERILDSAAAKRTGLQRLVLEIDAHGFVAYPDEVDAFCSLASRAGVGVGVRRLAEQPAALLRLHRVSIRYIKLGGDLISGLLESPGATQLIVAITEAAIGQGVKVYAHDVPDAATAAMLREYGVLLSVSDESSLQVQAGEAETVGI